MLDLGWTVLSHPLYSQDLASRDFHKLDIGMMVRVFTNSPRDLGWVIPKTQKMILDASLFNTHQYKLGIKGKVEQSRSSALPNTLV